MRRGRTGPDPQRKAPPPAEVREAELLFGFRKELFVFRLLRFFGEHFLLFRDLFHKGGVVDDEPFVDAFADGTEIILRGYAENEPCRN